MADTIECQKYLRLFQNLLPQGKAWNRDSDSVLTRLLQSLGLEFCRVEKRGKLFIDEVDPRTTTELLPDWERVMALPDECTEADLTLEERRLQIVQKLTERGSQNLAFYRSIAEQFGFEVVVHDFRPFRAGSSRAGDALTNEEWRFYFEVSGHGMSESHSVATFQCTIKKLKPAHTEVIFTAEPLPRFWND